MLLAGLLTLLTLWLVHFYLSLRRLRAFGSPGLCLPLVGHIWKFLTPEFTQDPVNALWQLYKKSQKGGMMWNRNFNLDMVWVGDFETLKFLFNHPDMADRFVFSSQAAERMTQGQEPAGVLGSNGKVWLDQRRFTLRTLRDFGFGKAGMEDMINDELAFFVEEIKKTEGEPFDFMNKFNLPILNALWMVTAGQRFDYDDEELKSITHRLTEWLKRISDRSSLLIICYPWITNLILTIFPGFLGRDKTLSVNHDMINMMKKIVKEHEQSIDHNDPRDFTDKVLTEIDQTKDPFSSFHGALGKENLVNTLFDLFLAGSETTSTTLTWAVLYMARYPGVQARVQEELEGVVGRGNTPSLGDRPSLPYTEATIMEIQRCANIIPSGVNHTSKRDITVNGFTIPAGTLVVPLMTELLKGSYWGDGGTFRPERFLDSSGQCRKDERLIPFSIGKRQCLGETLAKAELFLFFAGLVHQFNFLPEVDGELPTEEYTNGVTVLPKPFKLRLQSRT